MDYIWLPRSLSSPCRIVDPTLLIRQHSYQMKYYQGQTLFSLMVSFFLLYNILAQANRQVIQQQKIQMRAQQSTSLCDIKFKIVLLGDMGVGKTSIIQRFVKDQFETANNPTIGIDFLCRNMTIDKKTYRLQLWDTAGQQKYKSLVPAYLRDADCAIFVVDIIRPETLSNLNGWIQLYRDNQKQSAKAFLMANKMDLANQKTLQSQVLSDYAKRQGLIYWQVSAKSGKGINECFNQIVRLLARTNSKDKRQDDEYLELSQKFFAQYNKLQNNRQRKFMSCCYI